MRSLIGVGTAALVLTGCGGNTSPVAEPDTSGTRLVQHARGETAVLADPQRIVVLEPVQLDTAVALGRIPVGAAVLSEGTGVPDYLGEEAADVEPVGTFSEPDLEAIAALQPDLIIGTELRQSALYDQFSGIAPTVFMASQSDPWRDNAAFVAYALGEESAGEQLFADYDARCAEVAESYQTAGRTAQLIRPREDVLTLYGPASFAGGTLECAGFTIPERDWEGEISIDVSPENVTEARADLVVITSADPGDLSTLPDVIGLNTDAFPDPYLVDQSFWITGVGPRGGMVVLDDIERLLSGQ